MSARADAGGGGSTAAGRRADEHGVVSLEWMLALPLLALAVVGLLEVTAVMRDALLVHDAARAGVRAAATSTGTAPVEAAVAARLGPLDHAVEVSPRERTAGDLVEVTVAAERAVGPVTHPVRARAVARVEPVVGPGVGGRDP